jgi:phosphate transport system substrate-binding protein
MKRGLALVVAVSIVALAAVAGAGAKSNDTTITGAGSSFVAPLVAKWTPALGGAFGINLNYSAVGSGAGIAAVTNRTVDFGASDAPLTPDQTTACKGCVQIPWALSATSIAYNVPGASARLKLNGKVLADIFLGKITNWNDAAIQSVNKGTTLPSLKITPVFRSDASGTTFNFTDYLTHVSPEWKSKVGNSTQVSFPTGVGARGSSGVAGVVSRTDGALTYVDVAYSLANHLKFAYVQNAAGKFTLPGLRAITEAAKGVTLKSLGADNAGSIVNPSKAYAKAYPICTFTYVIVPTSSAKAAELRKMINWAVTLGQKQEYTAKLLFVPLPKPALVAAQKTIKKIQSAG